MRNIKLVNYIFIALVGLIIPNVALADLFGLSTNYDECVVNDMKGQDRTMRRYVTRSCERKFETRIYKSDSYSVPPIILTWRSESGEIIVAIKKNNSDYELTRAILTFSDVPCAQSKENNYKIISEANFSNWIPMQPPKKETSVKLNNANSYSCMRTLELYGKRIK